MGAIVAQNSSGRGDVWNGACESACQRNSTVPASAGFARLVKRLYTLSCMSIDSDSVVVLPRFGGDFSGEEKIPEIASIPCSSRARSSSVIPVFLRLSSAVRTRRTEYLFVYLPCTPTLKKAFSRLSRFLWGAILIAVCPGKDQARLPSLLDVLQRLWGRGVDRLFGCAQVG